MFERILKRMRERVRKREYVMTLHAEEEMNNDGLAIYDVERCILTGQILERALAGDLGRVELGRAIGDRDQRLLRQPGDAQERPGRRGLGLLGPIKYGNARGQHG